jgi:hypothetical protein
MDFNATIDLIIKDLREAGEIIDDLKKYPGVPALQVELARSKCKSAAEIIALLKTIQKTHSQDETEVYAHPESTLKETPLPDKQQSIKQESVSQPKVNKKVRSSQTSGKKSESAIIADTFSHLSSKLNDQLGSLREAEDDISDFLKSQPLTNLSEAIGINDKFLFIREIFKGNQESYNQAISKLDEVESLADARAVIISYTGENKENEAAKLLLDLVKRKFPSDE